MAAEQAGDNEHWGDSVVAARRGRTVPGLAQGHPVSVQI